MVGWWQGEYDAVYGRRPPKTDVEDAMEGKRDEWQSSRRKRAAEGHTPSQSSPCLCIDDKYRVRTPYLLKREFPRPPDLYLQDFWSVVNQGFDGSKGRAPPKICKTCTNPRPCRVQRTGARSAGSQLTLAYLQNVSSACISRSCISTSFNDQASYYIGSLDNINMRLFAFSDPFSSYTFSLLVLTLTALTAPSAVISSPGIQPFAESEPLTTGIAVQKRDEPPITRVTLANGWRVSFQLFSLITPTLPSLTELRFLYNNILFETGQKASQGQLTSWRMEYYLGRYALEFVVEKGFSDVVGWDIITAFAEKMLEMRAPMTFICHVAPPHQIAGVIIYLTADRRF
ncbi:MAG: hypothetical protein Q9181_003048 [Wetmoreana brouardii]